MSIDIKDSVIEQREEVSRPRPKNKHRPALDGVRALAIVLVMIYHATNQWPQGGFFSVDVFFVLSGYLIAGLLVVEYRRWGRIDLVAFYIRRARRLFPALILAVIGITLAAPLMLDDQSVATMKKDGIATALYYANWHFIAQGESYFGQFGDPSPFRHMWTLAIEEQFYFILPLLTVFLLTAARGKVRTYMWWMICLAGVSAVAMGWIYEPGSDPTRVYYGTDTRGQDLLLGSALAIFVRIAASRRSFSSRGATVLGILGLTVMGLMFTQFNEHDIFTYRGGFTVFVLATCALIASVELNQTGPVARVFATRWWAWIGKVSYGLYLWHWPIIIMLTPERTGLSLPVLFVVHFALTFALGALSYYVVEDPIRRNGLKPWIGRRAAVLVGFLCLPLAAIFVATFTPTVEVSPARNAQTGDRSLLGNLDQTAALRVLVVGDSVGFAIGYGFPQSAYPDVNVVGDVVFGCGTARQQIAVNGNAQPDMTKNECADVFGKWNENVEALNPDIVLWSLGGWEVFDHVIDGKIVQATSREYADHLLARLEDGLTQLGPNVDVVIPNVACYNQPSYVVGGEDMSKERNDPARAAAVNRILSTFAERHSQVHIFDVESHLCKDGNAINEFDGREVRDDGVHYTEFGAGKFWSWIMPRLEEIANVRVTRA